VAQSGLVGLVERRGPVAAFAEAYLEGQLVLCDFFGGKLYGWLEGWEALHVYATTSSIGRCDVVKGHLLERYIE
jgi:hypothetical protein